ncbi:hypothetical protein SAMN04488127_2071 [Bhargavaea ginsengi]|uniref:Uncharacterized protein n=1 Tax=Bhargavaea ginsengi TaxID=426757 RepID=A0A1H6ZEV4_9BACL|nr:hypothetical protein [Bhargavaea ginsengi]MCM3088580.1 hypothetical protein [Bhargavaea ginsengi]SEJ51848.1 hypothetical protein SAMN04488127_2071 [Bhargavaea ginsengi]
MGDLIVLLIGFLETRWPTKKNRLISRRLKLLKKSGVQRDLDVRYGPVVLQSTEYREWIGMQEVEDILRDPGRTEGFMRELDQYVKEQGL